MADNQNTQISETAIRTLEALERDLRETGAAGRKKAEELSRVYEDQKAGLGAHSGEILRLICSMEENAQGVERNLLRLAGKVHTAVLIRRRLCETTTKEQRDIARYEGKLYSTYCRKMRKPAEKSGDGKVKGIWKDGCFCADPQWVPTRSNPEKKSVRHLTEKLKDMYGICWGPIPFTDGYADFSSVAVAQIPLAAVMQMVESGQGNVTEDPIASMGNRRLNMEHADRLAAQLQIPIPGLRKGYSAEELKAWRIKNGFSWDETPINGLLLVPRVIHDNISHTGLTAIAQNYEVYKRRFTGHVMKKLKLTGKLDLRIDALGKASGKVIHLHK